MIFIAPVAFECDLIHSKIKLNIPMELNLLWYFIGILIIILCILIYIMYSNIRIIEEQLSKMVIIIIKLTAVLENKEKEIKYLNELLRRDIDYSQQNHPEWW
jgi:hypothetical protein